MKTIITKVIAGILLVSVMNQSLAMNPDKAKAKESSNSELTVTTLSVANPDKAKAQEPSAKITSKTLAHQHSASQCAAGKCPAQQNFVSQSSTSKSSSSGLLTYAQRVENFGPVAHMRAHLKDAWVSVKQANVEAHNWDATKKNWDISVAESEIIEEQDLTATHEAIIRAQASLVVAQELAHRALNPTLVDRITKAMVNKKNELVRTVRSNKNNIIGAVCAAGIVGGTCLGLKTGKLQIICRKLYTVMPSGSTVYSVASKCGKHVQSGFQSAAAFVRNGWAKAVVKN